MIPFKFFRGELLHRRASMNLIAGVQYRTIISDSNGGFIQRVHMGGQFPFEGTSYQFTWIDEPRLGNGYYINEPTIYPTTTYSNYSLPNFLMENSHKQIYIYSIECNGKIFFKEHCDELYHFTNEEPYRRLEIKAVTI